MKVRIVRESSDNRWILHTKASNAENVSMKWRLHVGFQTSLLTPPSYTIQNRNRALLRLFDESGMTDEKVTDRIICNIMCQIIEPFCSQILLFHPTAQTLIIHLNHAIFFTSSHTAIMPSALWGRVAHICIGKLTIWTNAGILLIESLGTNFSENLVATQTFSFKKMYLKISSGKWRPFCLGPNVLIDNKGFKTILHTARLSDAALHMASSRPFHWWRSCSYKVQESPPGMKKLAVPHFIRLFTGTGQTSVCAYSKPEPMRMHETSLIFPHSASLWILGMMTSPPCW